MVFIGDCWGIDGINRIGVRINGVSGGIGISGSFFSIIIRVSVGLINYIVIEKE